MCPKFIVSHDRVFLIQFPKNKTYVNNDHAEDSPETEVIGFFPYHLFLEKKGTPNTHKPSHPSMV